MTDHEHGHLLAEFQQLFTSVDTLRRIVLNPTEVDTKSPATCQDSSDIGLNRVRALLQEARKSISMN